MACDQYPLRAHRRYSGAPDWVQTQQASPTVPLLESPPSLHDDAHQRQQQEPQQQKSVAPGFPSSSYLLQPHAHPASPPPASAASAASVASSVPSPDVVRLQTRLQQITDKYADLPPWFVE